MLRRLFRFLSALSLLLCAAVVLLWVRSYWVADGCSWAVQTGTNAEGLPLGTSYTIVSSSPRRMGGPAQTRAPRSQPQAPPVRQLRLRPPRHPRPLPRMRDFFCAGEGITAC
jgi:hypothetical protein